MYNDSDMEMDDDNINDIDDVMSMNDHVSIVSESTNITTLDGNRKKQRENNDKYKNTDKGYHKITRKINNKNVVFELYSTVMTPGNMIRDAATGLRNNGLFIGSPNEDLFFKVKIATGSFGSETGCFFYNSPEHFERHMKLSVSQLVKERWNNKRIQTEVRRARAD